LSQLDAAGQQRGVCLSDDVKMADVGARWNRFSTTWSRAATWNAAHFIDDEGTKTASSKVGAYCENMQ